MKRRDFLRLGSAGCVSTVLGGMGLLSWTPRSQAAVISRTFYITEGTIDQIDGSSVYFRGFSASSGALDIPGEALIVQEGDTVQVTLVNTLSSSHSFVIDGIVDSGAIPPGETRTVSFSVNTPGTYMYYDGLNAPYNRCQPWRAKRRLVDPSSREAALFSRRALRQRENKVGLRTRRPVIWEPSTEQQRACEVVA